MAGLLDTLTLNKEETDKEFNTYLILFVEK